MNIIDLLMLSSDYIEEKEGVVITFSNGKMAKQKHKHYMHLHGLLSDGLKENKLVEKILNEEIDDVLSFLPVGAIAERDFVNGVADVITTHVNELATTIFNTFNESGISDRKEFAMKFKDHKHFFYMVLLFKENTFEIVEKALIKRVIYDCSRLYKAKAYLANLGFKIELNFLN